MLKMSQNFSSKVALRVSSNCLMLQLKMQAKFCPKIVRVLLGSL
jgi:hypothetical protein